MVLGIEACHSRHGSLDVAEVLDRNADKDLEGIEKRRVESQSLGTAEVARERLTMYAYSTQPLQNHQLILR